MALSMRFVLRCGVLAAALLTGGVLVAAPVPQSAPTPTELARLIQAHYDNVGAFTAGFIHTFKGGLLPQTTVERGTVKIKKPGRMRWVYESPNQPEIIADGRMVYSYVKADRVCYVSDMPQGNEVSTAVLFLAGKGDLMRDFRAAASPGSSAVEWRVQLTPIKAQSEFTQLTLGVNPKTLALLTLETVDVDGGVSSFRFTNLKENANLSDRDFLFTPPKGVDVIR